MLLGWEQTPIRYDGNIVYFNTHTNELAFEERGEHLIELPRPVARAICRLIARGYKPQEITTRMVEVEREAYALFVSPYLNEAQKCLERLLKCQ